MTLPQRLNAVAVVAVNVYRPHWPLPVGHLNLTFYWHGIDRGTYGYNSTGKDISGKVHRQSIPSPNMHGGVFAESDANALTHYVVVSDKNFSSMFAFAMSQAKLTTGRNNIRYILDGHNCADFAYQVFQHSDLTPDQKNVAGYLESTNPLAAQYAKDRSDHYMEQNIHDPQKLLAFRLTREQELPSTIGR